VVVEVGQAGRAKAPAPRALGDLVEAQAVLPHPAGDLVEGHLRALAAGHGLAPARAEVGDAPFHALMIMKLVFKFKGPDGSGIVGPMQGTGGVGGWGNGYKVPTAGGG